MVLLLLKMADFRGIDVTFVDTLDIAAYQAAIRPNTRAICIELLVSQADVAPIHGFSLAKYNCPLVVDHTVTTPFLCSAKDLGADVMAFSKSG